MSEAITEPQSQRVLDALEIAFWDAPYEAAGDLIPQQDIDEDERLRGASARNKRDYDPVAQAHVTVWDGITTQESDGELQLQRSICAKWDDSDLIVELNTSTGVIGAMHAPKDDPTFSAEEKLLQALKAVME